MKPLDIVRPGSPLAMELTGDTAGGSAAVFPWPAPLAQEAFHGLAGRFAHAIEPHTEADIAAVLVQFLVAFGNAIGSSAHYLVEADQHRMNLFAVMVGTTSKGRKGTSWGHVRRRLGAVDPTWAKERLLSGMSSGEGLIWAVRDPIYKHEAVKRSGRVTDYQDVLVDKGVEDKRLLVVEAEFASTLQVIRREGNTLSPLVRQAWDTGNLRTLTKNSPAVATGAHISIIGHITQQELLRQLETTEAGNGFANRFLWVCVRRSKLLPDGGQAGTVDWAPLESELAQAVQFARGVTRITRDDAAMQMWHAVYPTLSEGHAGLLGAVISRAEAQVVRLAGVYALLDRSSVISPPHLEAALAVWEYAETSAKFIFGDSLGDPLADEILQALRNSSAGLTRTDIRDLFSRNKGTTQITNALTLLRKHGLAEFKSEGTAGRPTEVWLAVRPSIINTTATNPNS